MPRKSEDAGQHDGNHDGFLHDVFSHKEGCVRFLLAYQMPDTDGSALCHGDAEQISEHDDVDTIGTGGERFHSQHVDEVGDDDLRRAVRQLFAGGGQAYLIRFFSSIHGKGRKYAGGKRWMCLRNSMTNSIIMETPRLKAVEMAAPSTPSSGKPKRPKMRE